MLAPLPKGSERGRLCCHQGDLAQLLLSNACPALFAGIAAEPERLGRCFRSRRRILQSISPFLKAVFLISKPGCRNRTGLTRLQGYSPLLQGLLQNSWLKTAQEDSAPQALPAGNGLTPSKKHGFPCIFINGEQLHPDKGLGWGEGEGRVHKTSLTDVAEAKPCLFES